MICFFNINPSSLRSASRRAIRLASHLAPLLLTATLGSPARAIIVVVSGNSYDVEIFNGSYNSDLSLFATPANGGRMPWWGDSVLADEFASQLGAGLSPAPLPAFGPLFAHTFSVSSVVASVLDLSTLGTTDFVDSSYSVAANSNESYAVLVAPPATASVPAPLPILGAFAAFRASRRIRRRGHLSAHVGPNAITSSSPSSTPKP
jgi:hypothetical protein